MSISKKTKIIATVGPATESVEQLRALYASGVNIIRFNFSHAKYESSRVILDRIRQLNEAGETQLSTLLDTKGPEIRTGDVVAKVQVHSGEEVILYTQSAPTKEGVCMLFCDYPYLASDVQIGGNIEIDSGLLTVEVIEKHETYVVTKAKNDCLIGSKRHVNLPGIRIRLPGVTDQDAQDVAFAIAEDFDFIALSFVRNAGNVAELRSILSANNAEHIKIISKLENQEGIDNMDEIIECSDGIMVARGDLGIEVPIQKLPIYQREIVKKSLFQGKFVIVATHMLETMIENPFPTRAEVSDIFNAIMQKTDCIMLSGETTLGKYPIRCVDIMTSVALEAEGQIRYKHDDFSDAGLTQRDKEKKALIKSGLEIGESLHADAIVIFTKSGLLARLAASFRPNKPVYAFTPSKQSQRTMNAYFGIAPRVISDWKNQPQENLESAIKLLKKEGILIQGSKIIAITDIYKDGIEVPAMEIIDIL